MSLEECRRLLGTVEISADDLERLRTQLYDLADAVVTAAMFDGRAPKIELPPDLAYDVEERAAILQFDAKMSPANASRAALVAYRRRR